MFSIVFYAFQLHTFCLLGSIPCRFFSCPQMMVCHNKIKITKGYSIRNYSPSSLSILQGKENIKKWLQEKSFHKIMQDTWRGQGWGGWGGIPSGKSLSNSEYCLYQITIPAIIAQKIYESQSNQVKHTPPKYFNELIIWILNPLVILRMHWIWIIAKLSPLVIPSLMSKTL